MRPSLIAFLFVLQAVTACLFVVEFLNTVFGIEVFRISWEVHEMIEIGILSSLLLGTALTAFILSKLIARTRHMEAQIMLASGEFSSLLETRFDDWDLTPAERDVALLNLKGLSVPEIAQMRGKSEGTIKTQNAALYRKAAVSGRTQLIVSFMEDILDQAIEARSNQA